jgi:MFS transporter, ACDE family, multidrug resistance protein
MKSAATEPHRRGIYAAVAAAYLAFAGIGIVDPILPVIATKIGINSWQVELLFTAYVAVMALGMIPAVLLASRRSNKAILLAGLLVVMLSATLAAFSGTITQLAAFRGTWGLGNAMFFATAMTIVVNLARDAEWAIGRWEAAIGLGLATGPLIGGVLGTVTWRLPFLACGVFMLFALLIAARAVTEPAGEKRPIRAGEPFRLFGRPAFAAIAAVAAAYNFCFFVILGYTPLVLHLPAIPLGLAFTGWGAGVAAGILGLGHPLAHRIGYVRTVGLSLAGILACLALMGTVSGRAATIAVLVVSGVFIGLVNATLTDLALGLTAGAGADRAVTTGAFNLVRWGGAAAAPVVSGYLGEHAGAATPFRLAAGVLLAGLVLFAATARRLAAGMGERTPWSVRSHRPVPEAA